MALSSIALSNKTCLIPDDLAVFIELVAIDPLCVDDLVNSWVWSLDQLPNIIQFELKKFILHGLSPFCFLECFINFSVL